MPGVAITGLQWGDEGKGKIIDNLAAEADVVVRYQGGANAGHTVWVGDEKYVLHIVPSGVLHEGTECIIGNGTVVDLADFKQELAGLEERGVKTDKVFLSERAHMVFPFHRMLDAAREESASDAEKIGTTKRGIGPCYADKMSRSGIRAIELFNEKLFRERLQFLVKEKNALLEHVYGKEPIEFEPLFETYRDLGSELKERIIDTSSKLQNDIRQRKRVLYEGAQGVMLDVDHGTFPYVTSSSSSVCGIPSGAGIAPNSVTNSIGVTKAYTTRVGDGPFPTELEGEEGEALREAGSEYGATTGRPRRCGILDLLQLRYAVNLCGVRGLALTKLDILSGLETLRVSIAYQYGDEVLTDFPADIEVLRQCKPMTRELPGFKEDITGAKALEELPREARRYIEYIEAHAGVPVVFMSTGPAREQFFRRGHGETLWE